TSVVEHLLGQSDDSLQPVVLNNPLSDITLARSGATRKQERAAEDDGQARAVFSFVRPHRLEFADHMLEEQEGAVVDSWETGAKAARETKLFVFPLDFPLLFLPIYPERGVGEEIVKGLIAELIFREAVTETDVIL